MKKSPGRKERRLDIEGKPSLLATYNTKPDPVVAARVHAENIKRNPDNLTYKALERKKLHQKVVVHSGQGQI